MTDALTSRGGPTGTAAAHWLANLVRSSPIVEARFRLGGRAPSRNLGISGGPNFGGLMEYGGGGIRVDHGQIIGHLSTGEALDLRWIYADRVLPDGATLLIAFGLPDEVEKPDHATVQAVLRAAFPGAELAGFDWHDGAHDPFARGAWVSPALATWPDYRPDNWRTRGRLAFAGADLYSAEQGWMKGVMLTACAALAALETHLQQDA